jgi:hypothetical protein
MSSKQGSGKAAGEQEIEHQANTNQVRHEPVPASHDDDRRPAAVREQLPDDQDAPEDEQDHESG